MLREADLIAAEDTRVTRKLLAHYDIHTPITSYHQHSRQIRSDEIIAALTEGKTVALVSDAGTPGISDPGHELIVRCIAEGIRIEPVPGPTAIVTALVVSGLPTDHFAFDGFPPRRKNEKRAFFAALASQTRTICLYEAPNRLPDTLHAIRETMGGRRVAVVREVTKVFEEIFRGSVDEAVEHFSEKPVRGEVVIVIDGARKEQPTTSAVSDEDITRRLGELLDSGLSRRDAVRQCSEEFDVPRRGVYSLAVKLKRSRADL